MALSSLLIYLTALAGAYILPGPDMAFVIATASAKGARTALVAAVGMALARGVHVALAGLGLAALMAANPRMLDVVRWMGAAYLCFIAYQLLRSDLGSAPGPQKPGSDRAFLLRGFLTNLLNPKPLLFCSLFLPQFVSNDAGPLSLQYLRLGAILVAVGFAFDIAFANCAVRVASRMKTPPRFIKFLLPTVFVTLAGRLIAN